MSGQTLKTNGLRTNIEVLDKMLGCDLTDSPDTSLPPGSVFLIRGEPGAGKTTLGLQILSAQLAQDDKNQKDEDKKSEIILFSLEKDPESVIDYANKEFGLFQNINEDRIMKIGEDLMEKFLETIVIVKNPINLDQLIKDLVDSTGKIIDEKYGEALAGLAYVIYSNIFKFIKNKKAKKEVEEKIKENIKKQGNENIPKVVMVDSLQVLLHIAQKLSKDIDSRLFLNEFCAAVRSHFKESLILFIGEYHFQDNQNLFIGSESFLCDTEIVLFSEPVSISDLAPAETKYPSPLGSTTLSTFDKQMKGVQTQSFCRVLKSRSTPNQCRRCAYDIVAGKGIEFYETYPGDGHLLLFAENENQKNIWESFFSEELPHLYPSLRYEYFDRASLQRTPAAQRRFRYVPRRTDMYLASFDNYWINWYSELCVRWLVSSVFENEFKGNELSKKEEEIFSKAVNHITAILLSDDKMVENISAAIKVKIKKPSKVLEITHELIEKITTDERKEKKASRQCLRCQWGRQVILQVCHHMNITGNSELAKNSFNMAINQLKNALNDEIQDNNKKDLIIDMKTKIIERVEDKQRNIVNELEEEEIKDVFIRLLKWSGDISFASECGIKNIAFANNKYIDKPWEILKEDKNITCFYKDRINSYFKDISIKGMNMDVICQDIINKTVINPIDRLFKPDCTKLVLQFINRKNDLDGKDINSSKIHDRNLILIAEIILSVLDDKERIMLHQIDPEKLRLFGERKSRIIPELERDQPGQNRPIHRPYWLFAMQNRNFYQSIPYDANISFIIYKTGIWNTFMEDLKNNDEKSRYMEFINDIVLEENLIVNQAINDYSGIFNDICKIGVAHQDDMKLSNEIKKENIKEYFNSKFYSKSHPETWEEIIAYFLMNPDERSNKKFIFETSVLDSWFATMLEFIWSCGGNLRVLPDYSIVNLKDTFKALTLAFYIISVMFKNGIIPYDSTLQPEEFINRYAGNNKKENKSNWIFARHWYSTFIDVLSLKNEGKKKEFRWNEDEEIDIMPIPLSINTVIDKKGKIEHVSCWGDWHFALVNGTENVELGIDLINYLMNSDSICERAFASATVPTVDAFYELYGHNRCFNVPDQKEKLIPKTTFNQLKQNYFRNAKSRSQIFDYHHCIRELHSVLEFTRQAKYDNNNNNNKKWDLSYEFKNNLTVKIKDALIKIIEFSDKNFLHS